MEWVRVWLVATWTPHGRVERVARTAAELRDLIGAARADPAVRRWTHTSRRTLVGEPPARCGAGHPLRTRGTLATPHDWWTCQCGGHWWLRCRECGQQILDPPPAYDCAPRPPGR